MTHTSLAKNSWAKLARPIHSMTALSVIGTTVMLGSFPAIAAPSNDFVGGKTSVSLSSDFVNALTTLKVTPGTVGGAQLKRGVASFSIVSGVADLGSAKLEVNHRGGLSLKAGGTIVELTDYAITNLDGKPILTGLVKANDNLVGRIPLFNLALTEEPTSMSNHGNTKIQLKGVGVKLSKPAADALNGVFKVTAFKEGLNIGTARVNGLAK
jgi:hypothetical protein